METLEKEQIFLSREVGKQRVDDEFPQLQSESLPKRSKLPLKRKTAFVSRPTLPAIKHTLTTRLNTIKLKDEVPDRLKNCKCKQSRCLKLYCLCFSSGKYCDGCSCTNCQNNVGNEGARQSALELILQRNRNAFRAIFTSSGECPLDNQIVRPTESGPLKLTYRSMLAGIIKMQKVREFCAVSVVISEAAKDKRGPVNLAIPSYERSQKNNAAQMAEYNGGPEDHGTKPNGSMGGILVDMIFKDSKCKAVVLKETPISPESLVPMCHEKDMSIHPDASSDKNLNSNCYSDIYIEQEKLVLARFLDFLNNLITCGAQKVLESNLSARANREDQSNSVGHNAVKTETEIGVHEHWG